MNKKQQETIDELYTIVQQAPEYKAEVMAILSDPNNEWNVNMDHWAEKDSLMTVHNIVEKDSIYDKFPQVKGFTQTENYSDDQILAIFESRDKLEESLAKIGDFPEHEDWYKAGVSADERIKELMPFYNKRKAEEWEQLESAVPAPVAPLMGPIQFLADLVAGPMDWRYDFKEDLHERGFDWPWKKGHRNPLTGFGAWDIAEFKKNPVTGDTGFSPLLLEYEDELEVLYGKEREWSEKMGEGGYWEKLPGSSTMTELDKLNTLIEEERLLDPRNIGVTQ